MHLFGFVIDNGRLMYEARDMQCYKSYDSFSRYCSNIPGILLSFVSYILVDLFNPSASINKANRIQITKNLII